MELAIKEGRFREDLYHRLNEFDIRQPSLEECPEDILPLAEFFRERFSKELKRETRGFTEDAKRRMLAYRWPGNVRELQNRVKRAVLVSENPLLELPELNTGGQMEHTNGGDRLYHVTIERRENRKRIHHKSPANMQRTS